MRVVMGFGSWRPVKAMRTRHALRRRRMCCGWRGRSVRADARRCPMLVWTWWLKVA
jgi:hypothetical protein